MSYQHQQIDYNIAENGATETAATMGTMAIGSQPLEVHGIWATVTDTVDTAAATLTFTYQPTPGSGTGATAIGTIVLPATAAIGKQYYKEVTPFKCNPGGQIIVTTDGGGDDGSASIGVRGVPVWEHPDNVANMIASA